MAGFPNNLHYQREVEDTEKRRHSAEVAGAEKLWENRCGTINESRCR